MPLKTLKATILALTLASAVGAEEPASRFIPASPENTRLADGSQFPQAADSLRWKWRAGTSNPGLLESIPNRKASQEMLMVMASGLEPGATYEVLGRFRAHFKKMRDASKNRPTLPAGFGLTLASMYYFDAKSAQEAPWIVTPDSEIGKAYGLYASVVTSEQTVTPGSSNSEGDGTTLTLAKLGFARAGTDGKIPVFISAFPDIGGKGRTVIDGIVVRPAAADAVISPAMNPATVLQLAIRAGDGVTLDRMIKANGDVNVLDEEGLTPLFYASAAGDSAIVRTLIKAGADPNAPGQSMPPLTGAATVPSEEITALLIEAGATVRNSAYETPGKLALKIDPRFIHPLVAAIRAGSLPVAKMLAARVPELTIESLYPDITKQDGSLSVTSGSDPSSLRPMSFLIAGAIGKEQWDLATWLLEKGCRPIGPHWGSIRDGTTGYDLFIIGPKYASLMLWAVAAGDEAVPFLNAMIERGYLPVIQPEYDSTFSGTDYSVFPWDALSAACLLGRGELVARFLPEAGDLDSIARGRLISLAMYSGNEPILRLLREKFPDAEPPRYEPEKDAHPVPKETHEDDTLRLLLPRSSPQPPKSSSTDGLVIAVIASPEASGPGDALSVYASAAEKWKVVDRKEVEAALGEKLLVKPWEKGTHRLSDLGDRLAADVLVIVNKLQGGSFSLYRFEAVEVATGLEIHREHFKDDEMDLETDLTGFLVRVESAMQRVRSNERREAVALISVSANKALTNSSSLARTLRAAIRARIDETPGYISLSRSQSGKLIEEQALTGSQSFWAAEHLLEAAVRPAKDGRVTVAIRLDTLRDGEKVQLDKEVTGLPTEIADLASTAWREVLKSQGVSARKRDAASRSKSAALEADRLVREVEWMMLMRADPEEILPMIETASALGAPADRIIPLHLDCLSRRISDFSRWGSRGILQNSCEGAIVPLPMSLYYSDKIVRSLPAATELLQQTSFYLQSDTSQGSRLKAAGTGDYGIFSGNEYWYVTNFLSFLRAAVYQYDLTASQRNEFEMFGRNLDEFTQVMFEKLVRNNLLRAIAHLHTRGFLDKFVLMRNPELSNGLALLLRECEGALLRNNNSFNWQLCIARNHEHHQWLDALGLLASKFLDLTKGDTSEKTARNRAIARYHLSQPDQRLAAYREAITSLLAIPETAGREGNGLLFPPIRAHSLESYLDQYSNDLPIHHGGKIIPHLVHSPRPAPDYFMRPLAYMGWFRLYSTPRSLGLHRKLRQSLGESFAKEMDKVANVHLNENKPELLRGIYEAALTWEMIVGYPVAASFAKNYDKYLAEDTKAEGEPIASELFVDTRVVDEMKCAFLCQFQADLKNPSSFWVKFHPYDQNVVPSRGSGDSGYAPDGVVSVVRRHPWILGIDLESGVIEKKFNLGNTPGLPARQTNPGYTMPRQMQSYAQSENKLLANIRWQADPEQPNDEFTVVIQKSSGKMDTLPNKVAVYQNSQFAAVVWKDDFFFLSVFNRLDDEGSYPPKYDLRRLDKNGSLHQITEFGRRPERTPFDREDRMPECIMIRGKNIGVMNSMYYMAEYSPQDQSWKILDPENNEEKNAIRMSFSAYKPISPEQIHGGRGWKIDHGRQLSQMLCFIHPKHGTRQVAIDLQIPKDFTDHVRYSGAREEKTDQSTVIYHTLTHASYIETDPLVPVVICQTSDHFVLALHFNARLFETSTGMRGGRFLPFLWRVSKEDVLRMLE